MDIKEIEKRLGLVEEALTRMGVSVSRSIDNADQRPELTCINNGVIIEFILRDLWRRLGIKGSPQGKELNDLRIVTTRKLEDEGLGIPRLIQDYITEIAIARNRSAHTMEATPEDALASLWKLSEVTRWYFVTFLPSMEQTRTAAPERRSGGTESESSQDQTDQSRPTGRSDSAKPRPSGPGPKTKSQPAGAPERAVPDDRRQQPAALAGIVSASAVEVLRLALIGAGAGAVLAAVVAMFSQYGGFVVGLALLLRVGVLCGLVTSAWLLGASLPERRAALIGVLVGGLGGWLIESITAQLWPMLSMRSGLVPAWTISGVVQWAAFGLAGGLVIDRSQAPRPTIAVAIALVVASVARTLILAWNLPVYMRDGFLLRNPLLFDLPVAVGWGVGLMLCPHADAPFRRAQPRAGESVAGADADEA
jgi:hypothetical protein